MRSEIGSSAHKQVDGEGPHEVSTRATPDDINDREALELLSHLLKVSSSDMDSAVARASKKSRENKRQRCLTVKYSVEVEA